MTMLGLNETQWGWRVSCPEMNEHEIVQLSEKLIEMIGMHRDGPPDCTYYPNREGKGGYGIQMYQKLVESFIVISTWPDHGFIRITLASCLPYEPRDISAFLATEVGVVEMSGGCSL